MIFAYIDPGSGSMLLQVLLAAALSAPFLLRRSIGRAWRRIRGRSDDPGERPAGEDRQ